LDQEVLYLLGRETRSGCRHIVVPHGEIHEVKVAAGIHFNGIADIGRCVDSGEVGI
jgi:hypothetical protein